MGCLSLSCASILNDHHYLFADHLTISILLSAFSMWNYNRINEQKEEQCREGGITEDRKDEFRNMGDHSPLFRYTL